MQGWLRCLKVGVNDHKWLSLKNAIKIYMFTMYTYLTTTARVPDQDPHQHLQTPNHYF